MLGLCDLGNDIEHGPSVIHIDAIRIAHVEHRIFTGAERNSLILRGQEIPNPSLKRRD